MAWWSGDALLRYTGHLCWTGSLAKLIKKIPVVLDALLLLDLPLCYRSPLCYTGSLAKLIKNISVVLDARLLLDMPRLLDRLPRQAD